MRRIVPPVLGLIILTLFFSCKPRESIKIDGSSTVFPITEAVVEEFGKLEKKIAITIGVSGTGGGFKKICAGELDVTNASRSVQQQELELCKKTGIQLLEFPIAIDGITIVVHADNNFFQKATIEELRKIYAETKDKAILWSDLEPEYPAEKISVYSPGQDSGTFDYFREVVLGKENEIRSDISVSEDDNFLVRGVSDSKYAIGFFGISYFQENQDSLKSVAIINPSTGVAVAPNPSTVSKKTYAPLSRNLYLYVQKNSLLMKRNVRDFIRFYLQNAEELSTAVGSVPQQATVYTKSLEELRSYGNTDSLE